MACRNEMQSTSTDLQITWFYSGHYSYSLRVAHLAHSCLPRSCMLPCFLACYHQWNDEMLFFQLSHNSLLVEYYYYHYYLTSVNLDERRWKDESFRNAHTSTNWLFWISISNVRLDLYICNGSQGGGVKNRSSMFYFFFSHPSRQWGCFPCNYLQQQCVFA